MSGGAAELQRAWVERVLGLRLPAGSQPPGVGELFDAAVNPDGSKVAFAKIKIQWNEAKKQARAALENLHGTVTDEFDDPETAEAARKILAITERFNEGLADTLDDLYSAADAGEQARLRDKAAAIAAHYLAYVDGDALIAHIEANPFTPTAVKRVLGPPLRNLQAQISAAARVAAGAITASAQ